MGPENALAALRERGSSPPHLQREHARVDPRTSEGLALGPEVLPYKIPSHIVSRHSMWARSRAIISGTSLSYFSEYTRPFFPHGSRIRTPPTRPMAPLKLPNRLDCACQVIWTAPPGAARPGSFPPARAGPGSRRELVELLEVEALGVATRGDHLGLVGGARRLYAVRGGRVDGVGVPVVFGGLVGLRRGAAVLFTPVGAAWRASGAGLVRFLELLLGPPRGRGLPLGWPGRGSARVAKKR